MGHQRRWWCLQTLCESEPTEALTFQTLSGGLADRFDNLVYCLFNYTVNGFEHRGRKAKTAVA